MKKTIGWIITSISIITLILGLLALYSAIELMIDYREIHIPNEAAGLLSLFGIIAFASKLAFIILFRVGLYLKRKP